MNNFSTPQVKVFPSAYRVSNASGKFTSEQNFTNLIKSLYDVDSFGGTRDGFVADWIPASGDVGILKIILGGYYFEVEGFNPKANTNCWMWIYVSKDYLMSNNRDATLDANAKFLGLSYGDVVPTGDSKPDYKLQVTDNEGHIINKGYLKGLIDSDGNWAEILIKNGNNYYINPKYLDFSSIKYLSGLIVGGALALYKQTGTSEFSPITTDAAAPVRFDNGVPVPISGPIGGATKPVYVDSEGKIAAFTNTIGSRGFAVAQNIYMNNGAFVGGKQIFITTGSTPTGTPSNGDLWFVLK